MLSILNLSVDVQGLRIIKNCSVSFAPGELHVIMGPNGSGKSSLASTIMGHPSYYGVAEGSILLHKEDLTHLPAHQRAMRGLFLGLQHPVEIQGLKVLHFLKELCSRSAGGVVTVEQTVQRVTPLLKLVGLSVETLDRCVNVGFSGGEKKRFELLQMMILNPKVAIMDELDSGVDIDGLQHVMRGLRWYREQNPDATIILITHYRHILKDLKPDMVHVMIGGTIVASGDTSMLDSIEQSGYEQYAKRN